MDIPRSMGLDIFGKYISGLGSTVQLWILQSDAYITFNRFYCYDTLQAENMVCFLSDGNDDAINLQIKNERLADRIVGCRQKNRRKQCRKFFSGKMRQIRLVHCHTEQTISYSFISCPNNCIICNSSSASKTALCVSLYFGLLLSIFNIFSTPYPRFNLPVL